MSHLDSETVYSVDAQRQIHAPDELSIFIEQHKKLIQKIAGDIKKKCPPTVELEDLLQTGILGLLEARNSYASCKGAQFSTYAGFKIKYAIYAWLRTCSGISRDLSQHIKKINQTIAILESQDSEVTSRNIAENLGISLDKYHTITQDIYHFMNMNSPEDDLDQTSDENQDSPMDQMLTSNLIHALQCNMKTLPERQQLILSLYYDQQLNFREIGEVLELTEARVSQLHTQTLKSLRTQL